MLITGYCMKQPKLYVEKKKQELQSCLIFFAKIAAFYRLYFEFSGNT